MISRTATILGVTFALLTLACQAAESPTAAPSSADVGAAAGGEIAAELNGVPITTSELDAWIKEELFRQAASNPSELFDMRQKGLDALLEERLLQIEADRLSLSIDEMIAQEAAKRPVTDEDVQKFFDENQERLGGASLEDVTERIREFLEMRGQAEARAGVIESAEVVIHLEPPRTVVAAEGPARGPADAPITIVEFSDFECPFCRRVLPALEQIMERYPDQVRVVYRNLPLRNHSRARPAAEAALCADEQGQFWEYHDKLFENARALSDEDLARYAEELGLDAAKFQECYAEQRFADQVSADMKAAKEAGVSGTPAFFVNGVRLSGAKPFSEFSRVIDSELARLESNEG